MRTAMRAARGRAMFLLVFACILLGAAELRLLHLQVLRARDPSESAVYRSFTLEEQGRRGDILDARGGLLATSVREVDVRVWTSGVRVLGGKDYRELLAQRLAALCGIDPAQTRRELARPDRWTLLARGVRDPSLVAALRSLTQEPGFRSVTLETRYVREYPRGALLAPMLGWVGWTEPEPDADPLFAKPAAFRGIAGIEGLCDTQLTPSPGRRLVHRDGLMREMLDPELQDAPPTAGAAVELTIEPLAQALVEESIDSAMEEFAPDWAQILVLDPRTCELKAVAQRPTPAAPRPAVDDDGNLPKGELALHQFLPAQRAYTPGSSFKPFMLGLVLERGGATPDTAVDCEHGAATFGSGGRGRVIHDSHPRGVLTATEVLVESSNIGMAKLVCALVPDGTRRGDPAFQPVLDHIKGLGFYRRIARWPGEEDGILPRLSAMDRNYALASLSFGQQIAVTGLQMATACAAVANGGTWLPPRLVRATVDSDGVATPFDPAAIEPHRIFTAATAAQVRGMLQHVVEDGSTRRWKPEGWSMGGKTGTAEEETDRSIPITSFWCFAPANEPRFLVLTVLYHPRKGRFAADNAAKVASLLMGGLLQRFEVPRDRPEELARIDAAAGDRTAAAPPPGNGGAVVASRAVGEGG